MKKVIAVILFSFLLLPWVFLNYGHWMDASTQAIKSDLIICLGGGTKERLHKAVKLFEKGYSKHASVILLGESYDTKEYLVKTYPLTPIEQHHDPKNTKEEVLYIKNYMLKHGYKTALIVTDPPHSRRVSVLNTVLSVEGDDDITIRMASSEVKWWKAQKYYDDKRSGETVLVETMGILYGILCYAIVEKLGGHCD